MFLRISKLSCLAVLLLVAGVLTAIADTVGPEVFELFPEKVGSFRRGGMASPPDHLKQSGIIKVDDPQGPFAAEIEYSGNKGQRYLVEVARFRQDFEAYSLLTVALTSHSKAQALDNKVGTSSFSGDQQTVFFKGRHFVRITDLNKSSASSREEFARSLADSYDKGEADIPALVKHLPNADQLQNKALFLTRFTSVQQLVSNQGVLSVIQTNGDGDAAFVDSGKGKVLMIEYNTPQLAKDNDERIIAKIKELWKLGQLSPSAYRRVGNYSVFVFDSPDEATAKQLINQVKYEQVVQWLGTNPYIYKQAEKEYVETTLGVFVAVIKASGYALVGCLALGGLFGALLFARRRAQRGALETYSDAGGMLRLNLDDLTSPQTDPSRLLGPAGK
jgi:hypothetical protein